MRLALLFFVLPIAACASAPESAAVDIAGLPSAAEAGWKGEKVCEVITDNAQMRVLRCTFPPGVGHEKHYHAPHFGYAIRGGRSHIIDARGERDAVTPDGYSWWTGEVSVHENQNTGDTTAVYLIIEPKNATR